MTGKVRDVLDWVFVLTWIASTVVAFLAVLKVIDLEVGYKATLWGICVVGVLRGLWDKWRRSRRKEIRFKSRIDPKIHEEIRSLIASASDATVFSQTFSWIDDRFAKLLKDKVSHGNRIQLYIPRLNSKVKELAGMGIEVREYGRAGAGDNVRFTLVNRHSAVKTLWIGEELDGHFLITEFSTRSDAELVATVSRLVDAIEHHVGSWTPAT